MNNWNLVEILKQFSSKQKLFVLIFMVLVIGSTTVVTTYLTTTSKDLEKAVMRLKSDNKALKNDIEKLKEREEELTLMVMDILEKATNLRNNLEEEENNRQVTSHASIELPQSYNPDDSISPPVVKSINYRLENNVNYKTIEALDDIIGTYKKRDTINN